LALLGIFVTVVAMAVGPAFQQSVGFYTSSVINEKLFAYTSTARGYNGTSFWDKDDYYNSVGMSSHHGTGGDAMCLIQL
jgi:hypothetical protein